jgi:hypothetical protein
VGRAWWTAFGVGLALAAGVAGCGDDGGGAEVVTQEQYEAEAERLCTQHGSVFERAYNDTAIDSDAEEVDFFLADFIPRAKAFINRLAELGFPPDRDADYREALTDALDALNELEAEPYRYVDDRHDGTIDPDEDFLTRVRRGFEAADIPC